MDAFWNMTFDLGSEMNHTNIYSHGTDIHDIDSEGHSSEHKIISSVGITLLIIISLLGNALVCLAVYQSKQLQSSVNYFVVSLAFSDMLVGMISMPLWLAFELTKFENLPPGIDSGTLIKGWIFIDILSGVASISNLVAISFERYFSVKSPLSHRMCMTNSYVALNLLVVWVYSITVASVYVGIWLWRWKVLLTSIIGFVLPLCLIIFAYSNVFLIVRTIPVNVISRQENQTVTRTLCILLAAFIICWSPFFIVSITTIHCYSCNVFVLKRQWIRSIVIWLHYLNSCCNPFLYCIFNAYYKDAFKAVLRKLFIRKHTTVLRQHAREIRPLSNLTRSTADRSSHFPFLESERLPCVGRHDTCSAELPLKETVDFVDLQCSDPRYVAFDIDEFNARREMECALTRSSSTKV